MDRSDPYAKCVIDRKNSCRKQTPKRGDSFIKPCAVRKKIVIITKISQKFTTVSDGSTNTHSERVNITKFLSHTIMSKSFSNIRADTQKESHHKTNEVLYLLRLNELSSISYNTTVLPG